jgi:hypothetical protein
MFVLISNLLSQKHTKFDLIVIGTRLLLWVCCELIYFRQKYNCTHKIGYSESDEINYDETYDFIPFLGVNDLSLLIPDYFTTRIRNIL